MTGGTGTVSSYVYNITSTGFDASGGVISNCTGTLSTPGGIVAIIGEDSSAVTAGKNQCNNGSIYNCEFTVSGSTSTHGVMLGNNTGGELYNNKVTGAAFTAIIKGQTGGIAHHNIGIGIVGVGACRAKAAVDCKFYNNTNICASGYGLYVDSDTATSIDSTGCEFKNNIIYFTGTATRLAQVSIGSDAVFSNNLYFSTVELPLTPFSYTVTSYATFELWQAAQELTAQYGDPLFNGVGVDDFTLTTQSPARNSGADVNLTSDYRGVSIPQEENTSIGAYEFLFSNSGGGESSIRLGLSIRI